MAFAPAGIKDMAAKAERARQSTLAMQMLARSAERQVTCLRAIIGIHVLIFLVLGVILWNLGRQREEAANFHRVEIAQMRSQGTALLEKIRDAEIAAGKRGAYWFHEFAEKELDDDTETNQPRKESR